MKPFDTSFFWLKVKKTDSCWLWTGGISDNGYGNFSYRPKKHGEVQPKQKNLGAHIASWIIHYGDTKGLQVCHTCDNPICVNPKHLFLGTHKQNMEDKVAKGRQPTGEAHGRAIATEEQVRGIRQLRSEGGSLAEAVSRFGLSVPSTRAIYYYRNWKGIK